MTATTNAQTAAMEALIDAHAVELKLPTVRRRYRAQLLRPDAWVHRSSAPCKLTCS